MKVVLPKVNADYNENADPSHYDYTAYTITTGCIDDYGITHRMGRGKYSEVFEGLDLRARARVVIKVLKPVRSSKISREVLVLRGLAHPNIITLKDVVHDKGHGCYSLIFDYIPHKDTMSVFEGHCPGTIRHYARQMLEALAYAHSRGIMHRDIKPQNMVISTKTRQMLIIDWGLAEFYHKRQEYSVRVATRYYKGPELLIEYPYYDYSLDIWSFGCILAELVFRTTPFFHGQKNSDQILALIKVLGTKDLRAYISAFEIPYDIPKATQVERVPLISFLPEDADFPLFKSAVDLLECILVYDHTKRPTAAECLEHPFFK